MSLQFIYKLFSAPRSVYLNYYDRSKFTLLWYTFLLFGMLFFFLSIVHFINDSKNLIVTILAFLIGIISLFFLRKLRKFEIVATYSVIVGVFINQLTLFLQVNPDKVVDAIWMMIVILFTFYVKNNTWGSVVLIINALSLIFYRQILGDNIVDINFDDYIFTDKLDYYLNIIFGSVFIGFLLVRIINAGNLTKEKYLLTNNQLRNQNKIVHQQNEEKTVMLKEIHHRVKNNLQVITSLLRLQAKDINDPKSIEHFKEAQNRIIAMSLIHEKMYQSTNLSKIDLSNYLESLCYDLIRSYNLESNIQVKVESNIDLILPKHLVPIALIFNELISNSLKHAFNEVENPEINIEIIKDETIIEVNYNDNGLWKTKEKNNSFGMELIDSLTEQLDGTFKLSTENGTNYQFKFPNNL